MKSVRLFGAPERLIVFQILY